MKKLILILAGIAFLSGCSGVKQFTVGEFAESVKDICSAPIASNKKTISGDKKSIQPISLSDSFDGFTKIVEANSKTGCSANITATGCSVSCGGSDTPKIGSVNKQ